MYFRSITQNQLNFMISHLINAVASRALLKNLFLIFTFCLCLLTQTSKSQRKFIHFYRDTLVKCGEYSIATENTYLRSGMFLKSTISIYNPKDQYLVLDYRSAYAVGEDGVRVNFAIMRTLLFYLRVGIDSA